MIQVILALVQLVKYVRAEQDCDLVWMSVDCYISRSLQWFGAVSSPLSLFSLITERITASVFYRTYENHWSKLGPTLLLLQVSVYHIKFSYNIVVLSLIDFSFGPTVGSYFWRVLFFNRGNTVHTRYILSSVGTIPSQEEMKMFVLKNFTFETGQTPQTE